MGYFWVNEAQEYLQHFDAQFDFAPDTSFQDAAKAIYDKAVERGDGTGQLIIDRFAARGIEF